MASFMGRDAGGPFRSRFFSASRCIRTPPASSRSSRPCSERESRWALLLAFMMSVIALSLPEMIILRKVLRPRLIAVFTGVVALGILVVGWLFNTIL